MLNASANATCEGQRTGYSNTVKVCGYIQKGVCIVCRHAHAHVCSNINRSHTGLAVTRTQNEQRRNECFPGVPQYPLFLVLGGWVNPHREQQTIPQGQTSIPPKSFSTPTANGQSAPRAGSARGVGRGAGSHTPSTASESFSHPPTLPCEKVKGYTKKRSCKRLV